MELTLFKSSCEFIFNFIPTDLLSREILAAVKRWLDLLRSHGLDDTHIASAFPELELTLDFVENARAIANKLNHGLLDSTSRLFNVRREYFSRVAEHPYDVELLDRESETFVTLLERLEVQDRDLELIVLRSQNCELETSWRQAGALVLRKPVLRIGSEQFYKYQPIFSLQDWGNPKQRWLALRAIWLAHQRGCTLRGKQVSPAQARAVALGAVFIEPLINCKLSTTWHPCDYVVRPSAVAKGGDVIEQLKSTI